MNGQATVTILEVWQLSKRFGGVEALSCVEFHVCDREIIGLIGPNGAGKTTLFNIMSGFDVPDEGLVVFNGESIIGLPPHEICNKGITRTFQMTRGFRGLTVLENIVVAALNGTKNLSEAKGRAREIIGAVGLRGFAEKRAGELSTGYQKRLELAKALATQPRLLLLDEVFTGLSQTAIDDTIRILESANQSGTAIVIIEHLMRPILALATRVVALDHGVKVAEGTPQSIALGAQHVGRYP